MLYLPLTCYCQTRSGTKFSPYAVGPPIVAPDKFDLRVKVRAALLRTKGDASRTRDPDEPALVPKGEPILSDTESMAHLFVDVMRPPNGLNGGPDAVTKRESHAGKHSHRRRRAKRAKDAQKAGSVASMGLKKVALKRLREAQALHADLDVVGAMTADTSTTMDLDLPIETSLTFGMEDVHVASTGFIGTLLPQSEEDKRAIPVSELRKREGWEYVPWDGK